MKLTNKDKIMIFIGDVHSNWNGIIFHTKLHKLKNEIFVQVGDFGIGFHEEVYDTKRLLELNEKLSKKNNKLYVIRGNHDDPKYFQGNHIYSNLKLLKDYTVLNIEEQNILFVGGALSVDRVKRDEYQKKHKDRLQWWPNEIFIFDEDKIKDIKDIDIVVTHTAPKFCPPYSVKSSLIAEMSKNDPTLIQGIIEERNEMEKLYFALKENNKIKYWFYGHFHNYETFTFEDTKFTLLDENQFYDFPLIKY
jgi:DNA repair exonuclease SbcCD nuclease subunit